MKNVAMPLIQMCTDGVAFLAHRNKLLNLTRRNYITSVLPCHMSELGKKYQRILIGSLDTILFPE